MVRAFGMNPKVGGSSPSLVETFSVSKTLTFSQEHPFVCRKWMLLPRTVNSSNVNFTSKISIPPEPVFKTWDNKCLALIAQMVIAFGMNPKVGVRFPLRSKHFLSQKLWHFHKNIRSCIENECCCPRTVNNSILLYFKTLKWSNNP